MRISTPKYRTNVWGSGMADFMLRKRQECTCLVEVMAEGQSLVPSMLQVRHLLPCVQVSFASKCCFFLKRWTLRSCGVGLVRGARPTLPRSKSAQTRRLPSQVCHLSLVAHQPPLSSMALPHMLPSLWYGSWAAPAGSVDFISNIHVIPHFQKAETARWRSVKWLSSVTDVTQQLGGLCTTVPRSHKLPAAAPHPWLTLWVCEP